MIRATSLLALSCFIFTSYYSLQRYHASQIIVVEAERALMEAPKPGHSAGMLQSDVPPWFSLKDGPGQHFLRPPSFWAATLGASVEHEEKIRNLLVKDLCTGLPRAECDRSHTDIQKSLQGTVGSKAWYTATHPQQGTLFARVDELKPQLLETTRRHVVEDRFKRMDILVPLKGLKRVERIAAFVGFVSQAAAIFNNEMMKIRILISKYPDDDEYYTQELIRSMFKKAGRKPTAPTVVLVPCGETTAATQADPQAQTFNRAASANCLVEQEACKEDDCIVTLMDVDIKITAPFFANAIAFVHPSTTIYFPIYYSEYNPESIKLVEDVRRHDVKMKQIHWALEEDYHGIWREDSTGMWAMAGSDAATLRMDESFVGWGGEDRDFHIRLVQQHNTVRIQDTGLLHKYHGKVCKGVQQDQVNACAISKVKQEGTTLGVYLQQYALMHR